MLVSEAAGPGNHPAHGVELVPVQWLVLGEVLHNKRAGLPDPTLLRARRSADMRSLTGMFFEPSLQRHRSSPAWSRTFGRVVFRINYGQPSLAEAWRHGVHETRGPTWTA
jgi:hypothetical protein